MSAIVSLGSSRCRMSRRATAPEAVNMEAKDSVVEVDSSAAFPAKLRCMLDAAERSGFEHIVSWQPNGKEFRVHDPDTFVKEVMPVFFNQSKYKSFQRQCNLYGFLRIIEGSSKGGYAHPAFIRSDPELARSISREKAVTKATPLPKKKKSKKQASAAIKQRLASPEVKREPASSVSSTSAAKKKRSKKQAPASPSPSVSSSNDRHSTKTVYQVIPESPRSVAEQDVELCMSSAFLPSEDLPDWHKSSPEESFQELKSSKDEMDPDEPVSMLDEFDIDPLFKFFAAEENEDDDSVGIAEIEADKLDPPKSSGSVVDGERDSTYSSSVSLPRVQLLPRAPPPSSSASTDIYEPSPSFCYNRDQDPAPISPCGRRGGFQEPAHSHQQSGCEIPPPCFAPPNSFAMQHTPYFPYKLFDMLDHADRYGFHCTISWLSDGRSFSIHDHHDFCTRIMPHYLGGMTRYDSFRRHLSQYGFIPGDAPGTYSHPSFYYGDRSCCQAVVKLR